VGRLSKTLCVLHSVTLVITQSAGCAQAPKRDSTALPTIAGTEVPTRVRGSAFLSSEDIALFERLEIVETGNHKPLDLHYDAALFLTADNAPNKPIPLWPASELKRASEPFSPTKDSRFQIIAPSGNYGVQVVYRSDHT